MSSPLYTLKTNKAFCLSNVIPSGKSKLLKGMHGITNYEHNLNVANPSICSLIVGFANGILACFPFVRIHKVTFKYPLGPVHSGEVEERIAHFWKNK